MSLPKQLITALISIIAPFLYKKLIGGPNPIPLDPNTFVQVLLWLVFAALGGNAIGNFARAKYLEVTHSTAPDKGRLLMMELTGGVIFISLLAGAYVFSH